MENDLQKQAAMAIGTLQSEVDDLKVELAFYKRASALAFKLNNGGSVAVEDIPEAIEGFSKKTEEELSVIEKAAELSSKAGQPLTFGRLSDDPQANGMSPEDIFIQNALLDEY